ncbi:MAG: hypothetical protein J6V73_04350 [Spirochaetaceae bacterium]|nr:hypothetical protein [Spirochaetaceae bacterium]
MMTRDENGNILDKLPAGAKLLQGKELVVIPYEGALPEYTPEAFNSVNMFFIRNVHKAFVDDICDREWMEENKDLQVKEIANICKIAGEKGSEADMLEISDKLKKLIKESDPASFKNDISSLVTLSVCFELNGKYIHLELPYCTIEKIVNIPAA